MSWIEDVLKSPYGSVLVALFVLLVEYLIVKPIVEGRRRLTSPPSISQIGIANEGGTVNQIIDQSHRLIIERVQRIENNDVKSRNAKQSKIATDNSDNELMQFGFLSLGTLIIGAFLSVALAKYGILISNVLLGVSFGTLASVVILGINQRRSVVPIWSWMLPNLVVSIFCYWAAKVITQGEYLGVSWHDFAVKLQDSSFVDSLSLVWHTFDFRVIMFFATQALGVAVLIVVTSIAFVRFIGVVVAVAALNRVDPSKYLSLVNRLYPKNSLTMVFFQTLIFAGLAALLFTGSYWPLYDWTQKAANSLIESLMATTK